MIVDIIQRCGRRTDKAAQTGSLQTNAFPIHLGQPNHGISSTAGIRDPLTTELQKVIDFHVPLPSSFTVTG